MVIILCFRKKILLAVNVSADMFTFVHVIGHHIGISTANVRFTLHVRPQGQQVSDSCLGWCFLLIKLFFVFNLTKL